MIAAAVNRLHPGCGRARTFFLPFGHFDERKRAVAARLKWILVVCTVAAALAAPAPAVAGETGGPLRAAALSGSNSAAARVPSHIAARPAATAIWGWCGLFDDSQKQVPTFERYRGDAGNGHWIRGGSSILHCGSSAKWGLRHIEAGHQSQWEYDAWLVGTNWRNQADTAIAEVLIDPDRVTYRSQNNTSCYSREIYLERNDNHRVVGTRIPKVVVAAVSKNIITAYPSDDQCEPNA